MKKLLPNLERIRQLDFAPCAKRILAKMSNALLGLVYRTNRSIQAEGAFGDIKYPLKSALFLNLKTNMHAMGNGLLKYTLFIE